MAILRGIGGRLKKIIKRDKIAVRKTSLKPAKEKAAKEIPKEIRGEQKIAVEKAKFSPSVYELPRFPRQMPQDLPGGYGQDKIVLQVRDPWWIHAYWEVSWATTERLKNELRDTFTSAERVLRVYDISQIIFNGTNAHRYFDIEITPEAQSWYIDTAGPGRSWCVDLGLRLSDGRFITIVRSNTVSTPLDGPSWITDEEWMIPDDMFARLYGMGFGLGRSSAVGKGWQEKVKREFISSGSVTSGASAVRRVSKKRKFWLVVNTELIVYGASEPDAKVCVQGREIKLRPDGTFSLRFSLPDGKQAIGVQGKSADGIDEITITPIVNKETR